MVIAPNFGGQTYGWPTYFPDTSNQCQFFFVGLLDSLIVICLQIFGAVGLIQLKKNRYEYERERRTSRTEEL